METKTCSKCGNEKQIEVFYMKYTDCHFCNTKSGLKPYYDNKVKISNQRKIYYGNNRDKLLRKQNNRNIVFKEMLRSYVELQNIWKAMEEKLTINDSDRN